MFSHLFLSEGLVSILVFSAANSFSRGRGSGQVVSVLTFYSDDPSSNPAEVYSCYSVHCLKRTIINKNSPGWPILKQFYQVIDPIKIADDWI